MAKDLPPSFQFYPRDFLADTEHLPDRPFRRYVRGLCRSWMVGAFGVGEVSEWRHWMGYTDPAEFDADLPLLEPLFFVTPTDPVCWVQKRMVEERRAQSERFAQAQRGGLSRAGSTRGQDGRFTSIAGPQHQLSSSYPPPLPPPPTPPPASASALESENLETLRPDGRESGAESTQETSSASEKAVLAEWKAAYENDLYPDYPPRGKLARRMNRERGLRVWMGLSPKTQETFDAVYTALERDKREWASRGDPEFIPMIDVWLRRKPWRD